MKTIMLTKKTLTGAILVIWLTLVCVTYWRTELRYLQPAQRPEGATTLMPEAQPPAPVQRFTTDAGEVSLQGKFTLLNFWSPNCACSRYMEPHVRD